jgi:hypothetical protein
MTKSLVRSLFLASSAAFLAVSSASAAGPYQFYSVTPCRIADTRVGGGFSGLQGPPSLAAGAQRNFPVAGLCGIPGGVDGAKAAALNVTVVGPSKEGFIKIWPFGQAIPAVSTINFVAGEPAIANGAIVPLGSDPTLHISVVYGTATPGGSANLILDVTGYFK